MIIQTIYPSLYDAGATTRFPGVSMSALAVTAARPAPREEKEDNGVPYCREISRRYDLFTSSIKAESALEQLDRMLLLEQKLLTENGYSYEKLINSVNVDRHSYTAGPRGSSLRDRELSVNMLPQNVIAALREGGAYEKVRMNAKAIFFTENKEAYKSIFRYPGSVAAMEVFTGSVIISGDPAKMNPIELGALIAHEAFHIGDYGRPGGYKEMEDRAYRYELGYWENIRRSDMVKSDMDLAVIDQNIGFIKDKLSSRNYTE